MRSPRSQDGHERRSRGMRPGGTGVSVWSCLLRVKQLGKTRVGGKTADGVKTLRWNSAGGTRVSCGLGGTGGSVRWGRDLGAQIDRGTWEAMALAESATDCEVARVRCERIFSDVLRPGSKRSTSLLHTHTHHPHHHRLCYCFHRHH